jgi:hypothetical protein
MRLGQLVGLEALDALGPTGVDLSLALPQIERRLGNPELLRERAHLLNRTSCAPGSCAQFVRPRGFEPRTCGLRVRCSAVELEAHRRV